MKKIALLVLAFFALHISSTHIQAAIPIAEQVVTTTKSLKEHDAATIVAKDQIKKKEQARADKTKRKKSWIKKLKQRAGDNIVVGALLALLLGNFGAHRFYYGDTGTGLIMLGITLVGIVLLSMLFLIVFAAGASIPLALPALGYIMITTTSIWAIIDFVRILTGDYPVRS